MWKKILQSWWLMFVLIMGIGLMSLASFRLWYDYRTVQTEVANSQKKYEEIKKSIADLEQLNKNSNQPAYLERLARLRLNYKKPDENVVFIYRNQSNAETSPTASPPLLANQPAWWEVVWQWLSNKIQ